MKILVTGVSGFIGGRIAAALARRHEVWGVYRTTRLKHLESNHGLTLIQDDLGCPTRLPDSCDFVVHAAADTPGTTKDGLRHWKSNRDGMQHLLEWSRTAGISRFMFFSTMDVYGSIGQACIDENTSPAQPNSYGASKLAAEQLLEEHSQKNADIRCITVRLPGVVGKEAHGTFLPRMVQNIFSGVPTVVYQKQSLFNNVVYIGNIIKFASDWSESSQHKGYTMFNAASECPIPLQKVIGVLAENFGRGCVVEENAQGRPPFLIATDLAKRSGFPIVSTQASLSAYAQEVLSAQQPIEETAAVPLGHGHSAIESIAD